MTRQYGLYLPNPEALTAMLDAGKHTYGFKAELSYEAIVQGGVYLRSGVSSETPPY
jgi:hypothetical protein